jgi:hypothetical protein
LVLQGSIFYRTVGVMPDSVLQQIEADIAEAERLITEVRFKMAISQSAGEDTSAGEVRLQDMLRGLLLLQDQRTKATDARPIIIESVQPTKDSPSPNDVDPAAAAVGQGDPAARP